MKSNDEKKCLKHFEKLPNVSDTTLLMVDAFVIMNVF